MSRFRNIGAVIKSVAGLRPQAAIAASTVTGVAIDRTGFQSAEILAFTGAETGAPTARTLACSLEDSADGSTGWAAITGATVPSVTVINGESRLAVDLTVTTKAFVRVVHVVSFTGGTSPTLFCGSTVVLGGHRSLPQ